MSLCSWFACWGFPKRAEAVLDQFSMYASIAGYLLVWSFSDVLVIPCLIKLILFLMERKWNAIPGLLYIHKNKSELLSDPCKENKQLHTYVNSIEKNNTQEYIQEDSGKYIREFFHLTRATTGLWNFNLKQVRWNFLYFLLSLVSRIGCQPFQKLKHLFCLATNKTIRAALVMSSHLIWIGKYIFRVYWFIQVGLIYAGWKVLPSNFRVGGKACPVWKLLG